MKRKAFIQKIGLLGVGFSLASWKFVSANSAAKVYQLPKPTVHIPHGNFAASNSDKLLIPELNLECTVQHFMRNGISPCNDDLTICSFQRDNQLLNICYTVNGKLFSEGEIKGLQININSPNRNFFSVASS